MNTSVFVLTAIVSFALGIVFILWLQNLPATRKRKALEYLRKIKEEEDERIKEETRRIRDQEEAVAYFKQKESSQSEIEEVILSLKCERKKIAESEDGLSRDHMEKIFYQKVDTHRLKFGDRLVCWALEKMQLPHRYMW